MIIPLAEAAINPNSAFARGGLVTAVESEVQGLMSSNVSGVCVCVCVCVCACVCVCVCVCVDYPQ